MFFELIVKYFTFGTNVAILVARDGINRGADKTLARPGRKQTTPTEDFDVYISYL